MPRINWENILVEIEDALEFFEKQGVKPTLRTLFYNLVSKNLIPNTRSSYQTLSKQLVEARKQKRFSWDFLEDRTRVTIGMTWDYGYSDDINERVKEKCEKLLDELDIEEVINEYFNQVDTWVSMSQWFKQKNIVEIWIEKEALASTIANWVSEDYIKIRVNKGYSSWTFIYNNVEDLKNILTNHDKIIILYCGDLDPSGVDIQRFLEEALEYFELQVEKVELKRLAITPEQVERYNLPPKPEDAETLEKLGRDPRSKRYTLDYVVELDSLVAYVPSEFKKLIKETIRQYFDEELYKELNTRRRRLQEENIRIVRDYIRKAKEKIVQIITSSKEEEEDYDEEEEEDEEEEDEW